MLTWFGETACNDTSQPQKKGKSFRTVIIAQQGQKHIHELSGTLFNK